MSVHKLAKPHVGDLWHATPTELTELFASITSTLRDLRRAIDGAKPEGVPGLIEKHLFEAGFGGQEMMDKVFARRVEDMPVAED
jgi:hypothetical protein